jgi:hypothetical protein
MVFEYRSKNATLVIAVCHEREVHEIIEPIYLKLKQV